MPIKILHIMQSLEVGGMENGVVNIVNKIDKKKYPSTIYCTKNLGSLANKLLDSKSVFFKHKDTSLLKVSARLLLYCLRNKPDIIHTHGWGTLVPGFVVAKILRIKIIHGEHGTVYFDRKKDVERQKYMLARTNKNLFVSKLLEKSFRHVITSCTNNRVIYNGVDINRFKPMSINVHDYYSNANNALIIGVVGRLVPVKNHLWLIEALNELLGESVKLMIVGDGELKNDIKNLIEKKKLRSKVCVYGETVQPEVLMNCFDVFVLPSLSEGLSNTIIEAMATGLPVIAANVGGNSELVSDNENGFLYESNNENDFKNKFRVLVDDQQKRHEFGCRSREIVENNFKMSKMIENYQDVYLEVHKG